MTAEKIRVNVDPDLEELIPRFMENTMKDINNILLAASQKDHETIRRIGHSMKSYGIGYGFEYISEAGRTMEKAAIDGRFDTVLENVSKLKKYLDQVEVVYG